MMSSDVFFAIVSALLWDYVRQLVLSNYSSDKKVSGNVISFIHGFGILIFGMLYSFEWLNIHVDTCYSLILYFSSGYYLMDTVKKFYYILNDMANSLIPINKNYEKQIKKRMEFMYIVHHIISVLIILACDNDEIKPLFIVGFSTMEISNLPLFAVYHLKHSGFNKTIITISTIVEVIIYSAIRIFYGFYLLFQSFFYGNEVFIPFLLIYILSVVWSKVLISQAIKLVKNQKKN